MHGPRAGAPRPEFGQFVTDPADQLLHTAYLMGQGRPHAEHICARINAPARAPPQARSRCNTASCPRRGFPARLLA